MAPRSASLPTTTGREVASRSAIWAPNGTSTQPRLGAKRTRPSACETTPQTPAPIPTQTESDEAPASTDRAELLDVPQDLGGLVVAARLAQLAPVEHLAAQPDARRDDVVDPDVQRERRRPAGSPAAP